MFYEQERQLWSVNLSTTLRALEEWSTSEDPPQHDGNQEEHQMNAALLN